MTVRELVPAMYQDGLRNLMGIETRPTRKYNFHTVRDFERREELRPKSRKQIVAEDLTTSPFASTIETQFFQEEPSTSSW